jgi:perosamine synthetase
MVVCREAALHKKCAKLKNQGISETVEYWHDEIAYNYRMTNICAAIGLAQLERAHRIIERKRQVAGWYAKALAGLPVELHREVGNVVHSYWMNSILVETPDQRDPLRKHLASAGIETRPAFYPVHLMPMYRLPDAHFPVAESLGARGINLPSSPLLEAIHIERIAEAISRFFRA